MSDLLAIGRSGVLAYRSALATVGENVANADTDGYSRRSVTLKEVSATATQPLYRASTSFGGVDATGVARAWDSFRASELRTSVSDEGRADARAQWLATVETALDDGAAGVGKQLTGVFTAAAALASDPAGSAPRATFLSAIDGAASAMRATAASLARTSEGLAAEAGQTVDGLNDALAALSRLNVSLGRTAAGSATRAQLEDQRDQLVNRIAGSIGVDVVLDGAGRARVSLAGSSATVLASETGAETLKVARSADGVLSILRASDDATVFPTAGALAGLIDVSATVADRRRTLDGIADQFATLVNDTQAAGLTPAGEAGLPLVSPGTGAATIALATRDTARVAAASATAANGNILTLAGQRGPGGVEARWAALVTGTAQSVSSAKAEGAAATLRRETAATSLDEVSGVDLDREAAEMLRFQQAYNGSAKIIQVARETLQTILQLF